MVVLNQTHNYCILHRIPVTKSNVEMGHRRLFDLILSECVRLQHSNDLYFSWHELGTQVCRIIDVGRVFYCDIFDLGAAYTDAAANLVVLKVDPHSTIFFCSL